MKKISWIILLLAIGTLVGVFAQRYWLSRYFQTSQAMRQEASEPDILYWVAPMDPNYRRDKPGKSPMGMDLVPIYAQNNVEDKDIVKISPAVENNLGVKTALVKRHDITRKISTVGYVTVDENKIAHIHTYVEGWIKDLKVKRQGEFVKKGQVLFELYSPTLVNAEQEFLLALKSNNPSLSDAAEKKLLTLGMSRSQIKELHQSRRVFKLVKIYAEQNGIISKLNVREGMHVMPTQTVLTIEDLSPIWMIAEVYERQANWVQAGQTTLATLPFMPGKAWHGKVDYVYPQLDTKTHTLRVRLIFKNPEFTIKPNMYADIKIEAKGVKDALTIPRSALIQTGEGARVILALGDGRYQAQAVKIGIESGNDVVVLSGLKVGDRVVTSSQFLIDSESNFKASFNRMTDPHSH